MTQSHHLFNLNQINWEPILCIYVYIIIRQNNQKKKDKEEKNTKKEKKKKYSKEKS